MILPARILSRIAVVRAQFSPDGELCASMHLVHAENVSDSDWEAAAKAVVIVVVGGHGVITKPDDSQIADRVRADSETFLWSESEGCISFMRREQLRGLDEELMAHKVVPARICCADAEADFATTAIACANRFRESLRWKELVRTSDSYSAVAQALVRRVALPVLGIFLLLLSGNMLVSSRLNARRQSLQAELAGREQTSSKTASANAAQVQIAREFGARPTISRAVVCDRIARAVPEYIHLTRLDVEPLLKRFEDGKPLERRAGTVVVCGAAPTAADVSQFVQGLSETKCCSDVQLTNVEKERDADRLSFRIELKL